MRVNMYAQKSPEPVLISLQAAGSAGYLPHWRLGAPRACGPLNARIALVNFAAVMFLTPSWFMIFAVVRT